MYASTLPPMQALAYWQSDLHPATPALLVRRILNDYLAKNPTNVAKELILDHIRKHEMTHFVTISFVASNSPDAAYRQLAGRVTTTAQPLGRFILFKNDRPIGDLLVRAYFSAMRRKFGVHGTLPALGVSETMKKNGVDTTYLHYHCLLALPCAQEDLFRQASNDFWASIGIRHFGTPIGCQIEQAVSKEAIACYALKNVGADYPIESIIMVGFNPPAAHAGALAAGSK
ncbi:hypothetical protein NLY43_06985 [Mesorhizobium sp. C416B]|uniref:hypothetical protein n=1 Tax=unclassified Mesorhizobium TaxID=325217 RepID=UPI0003CDED4A|nr:MULTISPECIES: hypothetical protein [unclassified Mesorhizobium]ESX46671.1 hypothetical protein X762_21545 [Mesorhizobium sp. LSHC426A00]ESX54458.1 hypothetical protein X761_16695 [Mesorhizobium sp. LSHC424B00]ESX72373.1 hypothetical protein X758_14725 [Mesorhizobium sp. LSHC416B00]WJI64500.1 hypothetical protein NLY43_06985 [Mesorhizobium sp. C416B]